MENIDNNQNIVYIYIKRPLALIKAQEKYRQNNKDKYNELAKKCYEKKKQDPEYIEKRKAYLKEKYLERKALNNN
jgi:hypothetical protein